MTIIGRTIAGVAAGGVAGPLLGIGTCWFAGVRDPAMVRAFDAVYGIMFYFVVFILLRNPRREESTT